MALKDLRFPVPFLEAYPKKLIASGQPEPDNEYNANRNAAPRQRVDEVTGLRQWKLTCMDPSETNPKRSAVQVIFLADVAPIPAGVEIGDGVHFIELEGLTLQPKVSGQGEFKSLGWTVRATGIKGDTSGAKLPPVEAPASRPARSDKAVA
ncbi:hypothetical protein AB0I30_07290 [Nocardia tengchongensis]|uniref:hypothetical protein n=1 Tax=Nocardia tengchongensis TaxID=2055889 RepID=UPI0033F3F84D